MFPSSKPPSWAQQLKAFLGFASPLFSWFNVTGHTVKRVMWFRVSAEGRREFAHHTDPNEVSLSYRGRTR